MDHLTLMPYNKALWEDLFGKDCPNLLKMQVTNAGRFSISKPYISRFLIELIERLIIENQLPPLDELTVTETCVGVGGFAIRLIKRVKHLNIVDISPMHIRIAESNILNAISDAENVFSSIRDIEKDRERFSSYAVDYTKCMHLIQQDIIICDPPWSIDYGKISNLSLCLGHVDIVHIVNSLYKEKKFKIFILFCPRNFDIQSFVKHCQADISIRKINKCEKSHYFLYIVNPF